MIRPFNPASPTISARSGKEIQASRNWKNSIVCKKIESLPFFKQGLLLDSLTKNAIITSKVKNGQVVL